MASVVDPRLPQTALESASPEPLHWLEQGERLDRDSFHARYAAMPHGTRAELIHGVVWMPSPMHFEHTRMDKDVFRWLDAYEQATPGVEFHQNLTTLIGSDNEVQPDFSLLVSAATTLHGAATSRGPLQGPSELVVEIASTTGSFDVHHKRPLYERAGVLEYVIVLARENRVLWFVRHGDTFEELELGGDGLFRSEVFPGLWLDPAALLQRNSARVREVVEQGLATAEHAEFVQRLGAQRESGTAV